MPLQKCNSANPQTDLASSSTFDGISFGLVERRHLMPRLARPTLRDAPPQLGVVFMRWRVEW